MASPSERDQAGSPGPGRAAWRAALAPASLRADALAGLSVAVVAVPQAIAYAIVAGLPPELAYLGVYTLIAQCLVGSLLSAHPLVSLGPINTQSLLVASAVTRLAAPGDVAVYIELTVALTLLKGALQLGMSAARLGRLARYLSRSVLVGFTAGAGVLIAAGQVGPFVGITPGDTGGWPGLIGAAAAVGPRLGEAQPAAAAIGAGCLAVVLGARALGRWVPGPLLAVVVGGAAVAALGLGPDRLPLMGELPRGVPTPGLPAVTLGQIEALLPAALALALLGMLEGYAIGKQLAEADGRRISANRELASQGVTHLVSGLFQSIPGSASFSRSALNQRAGARTALSGWFNAGFAAALYLLAAPAARYVPMASIAAILLVIAAQLIDWRYLRRVLRASRGDALVCLVTLGATLTLPLAYAVLLGVALNLAVYLRQASRLHLVEMVRTPGGAFIERPLHDQPGRHPVVFLQLEGDLFFGLADELERRLTRLDRQGVAVVILRLKRTHSIDATAMLVLDRFARRIRERGGHLLLCGVRPDLMQTLRRHGLIDRIGTDNVFPTELGTFGSAKRAIERARALSGLPLSTQGLAEDDGDAWAYEI